MLLGGDEFGRTQGGNNNGWCQDSEISWFDWSLLETQRRPARVHAQADRAAPRARRLPPPPVPVRARGGGLRPARTPPGSAPTASACATRTGAARRRSSASSSTARRSPRPTRAGARCSTSRSCCCSTRHHEDCAFTLPDGGVRRGVDGGASTRRARTREPASTSSGAGDGARAGPPLAGAAAPRLGMTELRATYRLQLGGDFGFAEPRASSCRTCATSASRTSTCRRPSRRARAPRTATTWSTRRRSRTSSAARRSSARSCDAVHEAGHGDRARHRPEPHGDRRREPLLDAIRSCARKFFDLDRGDRPPPALLRRRPPGRRAPGGPGGVRRDARSWRCGWCARAPSTGCGSTIRTGSPTPPATCSGCATAASSTCGWRRSSTPASTLRDWPVDGHRRLRVPQRRLRRCSSTPRARRR